MTFAELKSLLFERTNFGVKLGLPRVKSALALLGNPHLAAPALHVAGTNGKGSTCAFAEAALRAAGLRTGLYTSPHLLHFCERIRLDGDPISEERAAELLSTILARVPWALAGGPAGRDDGDGLTFFELATLIAFVAFAEAGVSAAVIEVGLGGRLDATNVVAPRACAVTSLGLEHMQYLGPTLASIAAEKAGIFKPGVPAVSALQEPEAAAVLERVAANVGAPLRFVEPLTLPLRLSLLGNYQRQNAAVARALIEESGLPVTAAQLERGLATARWPGRLEQASERPLVLLDGAHNPHAARALAATLPTILAGRPLHLVFAAMVDKDAAAMLAVLAPLASSVHLCATANPRAARPEALAAASALASPAASVALGPEGKAVSAAPARAVHQSVRAALDAARSAAGRDGVVLCCGSLYLVGEVQALLSGSGPGPMPSERL